MNPLVPHILPLLLRPFDWLENLRAARLEARREYQRKAVKRAEGRAGVKARVGVKARASKKPGKKAPDWLALRAKLREEDRVMR